MDKEDFNRQVAQNKKTAKNMLKGFVVVIGLLVVIGIFTALANNSGVSQTDQAKQVQPSPTTVVIEKYDIQVESKIIKKIGSKYRYFFSIKNAGDKDFKGNLTIKGNTDVGDIPLIWGLYSNDPLKAGLSRSVYPSADINANPANMKTFTFSATLNNQEVAKGSGKITENLE